MNITLGNTCTLSLCPGEVLRCLLLDFWKLKHCIVLPYQGDVKITQRVIHRRLFLLSRNAAAADHQKQLNYHTLQDVGA